MRKPNSKQALKQGPPAHPAIRISRGANPSRAELDALAALYPALLRSGAALLQTRELDTQLAEDLAQEASMRWFRKGLEFQSRSGMFRWLATCMGFVVREWARRDRRSEDALNQDPLSLDEPWARGE